MTFACVLKVCGTLRALQHGEKVHDQLVEAGFLEDNIVLCNILLDMYVKCGAIVKAHRTLQELPSRDVVSWNTLIAGYTRLGHDERALSCFDMMQHEGIFPTAMTFASVLKACGSMKAISRGEQIHHEIARHRLLDKDIVLGNALVDMYVKCGALLKAQEVLKNLPSRDVITWSTLISGYAQVGQADQALACFREMQLEGLSPNAVTYACVLKACGAIGDIEQGEKIHEDVMQQGLLKYSEVLGTALVDMYAKCGLLSKAKYVHDKLPSRSVGSWTALIAVYAQLAQGEQAVCCFEQMQHEGLQPNSLTFASALKACGTIGAIDKGEQIHDEISRQGLLGSDVALGNALVDMYIKCGALLKAQKVFEMLSARNVATWNTLIAGFAQVGQSDYVLNCLQLMQHEGIHPNASTLSCMLNACRFRGLVDDAYIYFMNMSTNYGVGPHLEHYISMVNSFGNAGHLDKAFNIIQGMPCSDYPEVWLAFLGACQKWKDISFGRWAFEQLIQLNKNDATAYIIMINIYSATGMQDEAIMIENMMNENNAY
ncbi:hypothetical protein KP509_01G084700 [Ceratopteris richardii]|nr:hypothetical protein KP509_01G084700 [Ceratopteris richardii]